MADEKIKVGDIEGSKDAVLDFIKESGADIPSLLNDPKSIRVPFWSIVFVSALFMALIFVIAVVSLNEAWFKIISLSCIALGVILIAIVYMAYRSGTLASIRAFGEVILLAVSLGVYSPKEAVEKIGEKLENIIGK